MTQIKSTVPAESIYISPDLEVDLKNRLSRIQGHVGGVRKMLEDHRDCDDILTQVAGVKAAVDQVAILLLEGHLDSCVSEAVQRGDRSIPIERFKASLSRVLKNR